MTAPVVLVLDDVHMLHDPGCGAVLSVLANHMPGGSRLVLAGRDEPPLEIPRLRCSSATSSSLSATPASRSSGDASSRVSARSPGPISTILPAGGGAEVLPQRVMSARPLI